MHHQRSHLRLSISITAVIILLGLILPAIAQDDDDNRPIILTPGIPAGPTPTPTLPAGTCFEPLAIAIDSTITIDVLVNIRAQPSGSSAIVWNTIYNSYNSLQTPIAPQAIPARVVDGPVCSEGYNWWRVEIVGEDGWVAEGRPDREGYLLNVPGVTTARAACDPRYDLAVGTTADLITNVRVRADANPSARVLTVAPAGSVVDIVDGAQCVDGDLWWQVRVTVVGESYVGWLAESDNKVYWLLPSDLPTLADGTLCGNPLPFAEGERGIVNSVQTDTPRRLRAGPGLTGDPLFLMVENVPFEIVGGPVCRDNLNWWQVRVLASTPVIGWVAEGSTGVGYWLEEVSPDEYAR
jgi:hypothetical protein